MENFLILKFFQHNTYCWDQIACHGTSVMPHSLLQSTLLKKKRRTTKKTDRGAPGIHHKMIQMWVTYELVKCCTFTDSTKKRMFTFHHLHPKLKTTSTISVKQLMIMRIKLGEYMNFFMMRHYTWDFFKNALFQKYHRQHIMWISKLCFQLLY